MKCEYCGKEHDGTYGSGRFCCQQCARGFSTKAKRKEINKRVSKTLKRKAFGKWVSERNKRMYAEGWHPKSWDSEVRKRNAAKAAGEKSHQLWLERNVSVTEQQGRLRFKLSITNKELEEYRKSHPVCEICGREEVSDTLHRGHPNKLCVDHSHKTKEFRGLLCQSCNHKLGWFENNQEAILKYLGLVS